MYETVTCIFAILMLILQPSGGQDCQDADCVAASKDILKYMIPDEQPCDNFYNFVCGGLEKPELNRENEWYGWNSVKTVIRERLGDSLHDFFEKPLVWTHMRVFNQMKLFYQSCMNDNNNTADFRRSLIDLKAMFETGGGLPMLVGQNWRDDNWDWVEALVQLKKLGFSGNYIISLDINKDVKKTSDDHRDFIVEDLIVELDPFFLKTEVEFINAKDNIRILFDAVSDVYFGKSGNNHYMRDLDGILRIMEEIFNIYDEAEVKSKSITLRELVKEYSGVPWRSFLNSFIHPFHVIYDNKIINKIPLGNFKSLIRLLNLPSNKRNVANFIFLRAIQEVGIAMPKEIRAALSTIGDTHRSTTPVREPWKHCTVATAEALKIIVDSMLLRKNYTSPLDITVAKVLDDVKSSFLYLLQKVNSEDRRGEAFFSDSEITGVKHAVDMKIIDDLYLLRYYKDINFQPKRFLKNFLDLKLARRRYDLEHLTNPALPNLEGQNADYVAVPPSDLMNKIRVSDKIKYLLYGHIATEIARQIFYKVNNTFIPFLNQKMKFENTSIKYCKSKNNDMPYFPGMLNDNDQLADIISLRTAYFSYSQYFALDSRLPGIKYGPKQLFWIIALQRFCEKQKSANLQGEPYSFSNGKYRVDSAVCKLPEISKDFNCLL